MGVMGVSQRRRHDSVSWQEAELQLVKTVLTGVLLPSQVSGWWAVGVVGRLETQDRSWHDSSARPQV